MTLSVDLGISKERDQQTLEVLQDAFEHGVRRFIFQPFHVQKQNGQEVGAATRIQALESPVSSTSCRRTPPSARRPTPTAAPTSTACGRIKPKLEEMGASVGTNREGFKPPF